MGSRLEPGCAVLDALSLLGSDRAKSAAGVGARLVRGYAGDVADECAALHTNTAFKLN